MLEVKIRRIYSEIEILKVRGRSFATRKKEHIRNVKTAAKGSRVANHAWSHNHGIDYNNASIMDKGNFSNRKFLESWHTFTTPDVDNNSCPLPGQYRILFNKNSSSSFFPNFTLLLSFLSHYIFSEFLLHSSFCLLKTTALVVESLQFLMFLSQRTPIQVFYNNNNIVFYRHLKNPPMTSAIPGQCSTKDHCLNCPGKYTFPFHL